MRPYLAMAVGLLACVGLAWSEDGTTSRPGSAWDALGLGKVTSAKVVHYPKGLAAGSGQTVAVADRQRLAGIERLLRSMPPRTDIAKDFDAGLESWRLALTDNVGKTATLEFISTAMYAPQGGFVSGPDSQAVVKLLREALATSTAPTSHPASSRAATTAGARSTSGVSG